MVKVAKVAKIHKLHTSLKQSHASISLLLICFEVMKVRPITLIVVVHAVVLLVHRPKTFDFAQPLIFFLVQDNALTPKRRSYMEAVSNSQLNINPMEEEEPVSKVTPRRSYMTAVSNSEINLLEDAPPRHAKSA